MALETTYFSITAKSLITRRRKWKKKEDEARGEGLQRKLGEEKNDKIGGCFLT